MQRNSKATWKSEVAKAVFAFVGLGAIWIAYKTGIILWMTTALIAPIAHK
jgi:hypothetical protein